mgnify:CR=1 FL=1
MGTTNSEHSHGGLKAAFAQKPFANIRGANKGTCTMHTPRHRLYYPDWDRGVRRRRTLPNLLKGQSAYWHD